MADYKFREFQGPADARRQYELWLRATADLPRAWRSCLRNVEHQLEDAAANPRCRLYAESADGTLRGYIGNHSPFEWLADQHGPPAESLGWTIPLGFPWTDPLDEDLEAALYDAMIRAIPEIYADFSRDIYIQRYRESWSRHIAFLEQRGWRCHARVPLIGREIGTPGLPTDELIPVTREDLPLISELSGADQTASQKFSTEELQQRYDGGWIVSETFWRLGERGAFALEPRGRWSAVTVLWARPEDWDDTLRAAATQAAALGAREIYFTVEAHETDRRQALEHRHFTEVDAGVYYIRDAV